MNILTFILAAGIASSALGSEYISSIQLPGGEIRLLRDSELRQEISDAKYLTPTSIVGGANVTIVTNASGSVTISVDGGGGVSGIEAGTNIVFGTGADGAVVINSIVVDTIDIGGSNAVAGSAVYTAIDNAMAESKAYTDSRTVYPKATTSTVLYYEDGVIEVADILEYTSEVFPHSSESSVSYAFGGNNCSSIGMDAPDTRYADFPDAVVISQEAFSRQFILSALFPGAREIGDGSFSYCDRLKETDFSSAQTVGDEAFYDCISIKTISLPEATSLGAFCLANCSSLETVDIPKAATIGASAFRGCVALQSIHLPAMTQMGAGLFNGCTRLTEVNFGNTPRESVPEYGVNAFVGVPTNCVIVVPDLQYEAWTTSTGWDALKTRGFRFVRYSEWEIARLGDLPTRVSQLTNDLDYVESSTLSNIVTGIIGYGPTSVSNIVVPLTKELVGNYSETVTNIVTDMESQYPEIVTNITEAILRDEISLFLTEELVDATVPKVATNLANDAELINRIVDQTSSELYNVAVTDIEYRVVNDIGGMVIERLDNVDTTYKRTFGISETNQSIQIVVPSNIVEGICQLKMPVTEDRVKDWIVFVPPQDEDIYILPPTNIVLWLNFDPNYFLNWEGTTATESHAIRCYKGNPMGLFFTQVETSVFTCNVQSYWAVTNNFPWVKPAL